MLSSVTNDARCFLQHRKEGMAFMFLTLLEGKQKTAFLGLAKRLINADARLSRGEANLVELMKREMGLSGEVVIQPGSMTEEIQEFNSHDTRIAALLELLGLACSDGEYCNEEKGLVEELAKAFGVNDDELLSMENWALRQLALGREATLFFLDKGDS